MNRLTAYALLLTMVFAVAGTAQAPDPLPISISPLAGGIQQQAAIVADRQGGLLVAWRDSSQAGERVLLQGLDPLGGRQTAFATANLNNFRGAAGPDLAVDFNGRTAVSWQENVFGTRTVHYRLYDIRGNARHGSPLPPSGVRMIIGRVPAVAMDSTGNVLLVFQSDRQGDSDIYGNWYAAEDTLGLVNADSARYAWLGDARLNPSTDGEQTAPDIAANRKGHVVVAWRDTRPDSAGIYCRVFGSGGLGVAYYRLPSGRPDTITALSPPKVEAGLIDSDSSYFLVTWTQTLEGGSPQLRLARISLDRWSDPPVARLDSTVQVLRARQLLHFARPSLSCDEQGNTMLAWGEDRNILGMAFDMGDALNSGTMTFTSERPGFGTPALAPAAAVRPDGGFYLAWEDTSQTATDLRMQSFSREGFVDNPLYISPGRDGAGRSAYASLVASPDGGFRVFWEDQEDNGIPAIQTAEYDVSGRPVTLAHRLTESGWGQRRPVAVRGESGRTSLCWQESSSEGYRIRAMLTGTSGELPGDLLTVAQASGSHLGGASAASGADGGSYFVWERSSPLHPEPDLMLARFDSTGSQAGSAVTVVSSVAGGGRLASVAVNREGNHLVLWRQGTAGEQNAYIRGRIYGPAGQTVRDGLTVSRRLLDYIGGAGRPLAIATPAGGNFLVLWQEFYGQRQNIYYRMYSPSGDSLDLGDGVYSSRLGGSVDDQYYEIAQASPAAAVDSTGNFIVVWAEVDPGQATSLAGIRLDSTGAAMGGVFNVPGVEMAALPAVNILAPGKVAVAWQDTVGTRMRLLAARLDFYSLTGTVLLSSTLYGGPVYVRIEGNMTDSSLVAADGSFSFDNVIEGDYTLEVTRNGEPVPSAATAFSLGSGGGGAKVDLGVVADLSDEPGPGLPRAGGLRLYPNTPNPFNPSTTIRYHVPEEKGKILVDLRVYDLRGRLVRKLESALKSPGLHSIEWEGTDGIGRRIASGVYFLRLEAGGQVRTRKMILLK